VKLERLVRLQAQLDLQERTISQAMVGSVQRVLVDAPAKKNAQELSGRTANNRWVNFAGPAALLHRFTDVIITDALRHTLRGRLHGADA
jgi:tRNA-2-methylthio-N6-dimethylallyladenosine synthase